ncbi:SRPBCC domain-containing protein [candidate division KSB1 bacterium]|nr:SRPBCC domain-containing protein [candidate division KSB1 bacterium]
MKTKYSYVLLMIVFVGMFTSCNKKHTLPYGVFTFQQQLTLSGTPNSIYDTVTGDISGWWDHSFSEKPYKLYIEPKPGGGFYEIYNEAGDGVKHATVIVADRGKMLRFEGPLGLSGKAILLVCTYSFKAVGTDSTTLTLDVHASGEIEQGIDKIVAQVWHHFLVERLKPYVEAVKN